MSYRGGDITLPCPLVRNGFQVIHEGGRKSLKKKKILSICSYSENIWKAKEGKKGEGVWRENGRAWQLHYSCSFIQDLSNEQQHSSHLRPNVSNGEQQSQLESINQTKDIINHCHSLQASPRTAVITAEQSALRRQLSKRIPSVRFYMIIVVVIIKQMSSFWFHVI